MSSFHLPNNSNVANARDERRETEHGTLQSGPITPSQGQGAAGPRPALGAILEQAKERTGAAGAAIVLGTDNTVCCRASTGAPAPEVGARLNAGVSITSLCLRTGEILVCNDTNTDSRVDPQLCKGRGIRSLLVLPIKQNAKVIGVLEVMSVLPNSFNPHDAAAMSELADQVLPLLSDSATVSDRLDQLQNEDFDAARDFPELWAHTDVPEGSNNRLPTTDAAEAAMRESADQVLPLLSDSATVSDRLDQLPNEDFDAARDFPELWAHTGIPEGSNNCLPTMDAAEAAMSKSADQVLPLLSESATVSDPLPNEDSDVARDFPDLWVHTDVAKENNNRLLTTDAAEVVESNGPYIESRLPHQTVIRWSQEHRSWAHWLGAGLAAALVLGMIGYGFHLSRPKVATHGAILPVAPANHELATPQPEVLSVQNDEPSKASDNVLTATMQETILAIQDPIQGTDVNRTLNRANAGDSIAQYEMGLRYADGEGVPQNYQDAMAWFAKAAENGNNKAQWKLGLGYMKGIGVPHDERTAVAWFKRAANQGDIRAQSALSDAYLSGRGIPKDYVRAYTWSAISAGLRENDNDQLRLMGSRMTAGEIEDAHRRISIWWEHHSRGADIPASSQRTGMPHVSDK